MLRRAPLFHGQACPGAPLPLVPGEALSIQVQRAVPISAPVGSYTVRVTAYRDAVSIATAEFVVDVI